MVYVRSVWNVGIDLQFVVVMHVCLLHEARAVVLEDDRDR